MLDTLKQRLRVLTTRLERYKISLRRKQDNRLFSRNEKQFYNKIREPEKVAQEKLPLETEVREFWENIWSREVSHNHQAEWMRSEEERVKQNEKMEDHKQ